MYRTPSRRSVEIATGHQSCNEKVQKVTPFFKILHSPNKPTMSEDPELQKKQKKKASKKKKRKSEERPLKDKATKEASHDDSDSDDDDLLTAAAQWAKSAEDEVDATTVYSLHLTQLSFEAKEYEIRALFEKKGCVVTSVRLVYDRAPGFDKMFRGVAFVDVRGKQSYDKALSLHRDMLLGRRINVRPAKTPEELADIVERTKELVAKKIERQREKDDAEENGEKIKKKKPSKKSDKKKSPKRKDQDGEAADGHGKKKKQKVDSSSEGGDKKDDATPKLTKKERNRRAAIIMMKRRGR